MAFWKKTISISAVEKMAATAVSSAGDATTTIYLLNGTGKPPQSSDINRTAGAPIGVTDDSWPMYESAKMSHLITLDVSQTPNLAKKLSEDTKAIAVFVSNLFDNEAFEPGTKESRVIEISKQDIAHGVGEWEPDEDDQEFSKPQSFTCHELEVPEDLFSDNLCERSQKDPLVILLNAISHYGMAGGSPIWIQSPEHNGQFILQFSESLVTTNLGDGGEMYVFSDTAFWQCH